MKIRENVIFILAVTAIVIVFLLSIPRWILTLLGFGTLVYVWNYIGKHTTCFKIVKNWMKEQLNMWKD